MGTNEVLPFNQELRRTKLLVFSWYDTLEKQYLSTVTAPSISEQWRLYIEVYQQMRYESILEEAAKGIEEGWW